MTEQVSPLRQRMIEDMTIRNMSLNTQKAYIRAVKNFSLHFGKSPDKLTFENVREYQLHLVSRGPASRNHCPHHVCHTVLLQHHARHEGRNRAYPSRPQGRYLACGSDCFAIKWCCS